MTGLSSIIPGARIVVQLGVGDTRTPVGQARWDVSRWNNPTALWAGSEPTWFDITCDVQRLTSHVGRDRTADRWEVGTCQLTVRNGTGWADILAPPAPPATLTVRPGRPLRWGVSLDGGPVVWRWRGFVDVVAADYTGMLPVLDTVTLAGVDAVGEVGRARLAKLAVPVGAGETATARLHRILGAAGWSTGERVLDATSVTVTATDLDAQVLDLLTVTADSAAGALYGDVDGKVRFRQRDWQTWMPGTPVDAVIGNVAPGDVCPSSYSSARFERADATTRAVVARTGGADHVADDLPAQIVYGVETGPTRTDLIADQDGQLDRIASRLLRTRGVATMPRLAAVEFNAARSGVTRDLVAAADPARPSRYRCRLNRGGRPVWDRTMFATAVDHDITGTAWRCRITLDDAMPWAAAGGRWDGASWDQATWTAPLAAAFADLLAALERSAA